MTLQSITKKHAFNRMKRTRLQCDIIIFKRCRAKAKRVFLMPKHLLGNNTALHSRPTPISHVWQVIKSFLGQRSSHRIPTLVANGISGKNSQHKANILAHQIVLPSSSSNYTPHFVNSTLPKNGQNLHLTLSHPLSKDTRLNQAFSIVELLSALKDTKNTTPGLNNICYEMFINTCLSNL